jgi:hypothetical protein
VYNADFEEEFIPIYLLVRLCYIPQRAVANIFS